ncbi:heparinase II/III family protein [Halobacillus salinarum]|uniref:Heparinase II/III family protein n=1 Tax=Halobacillus salinarum TaxID=2932257 RepID=A0ABY4EHG3_9BACI|nr:alginate lyase family protein [Halobacillus salinarum]UOQ43900.1 heparinase II/III family protein [Halobacillus salinarum]
MQTLSEPRFFYSYDQSKEITRLSKEMWPEEVNELLNRADLACQNTFIFTHRWDMERCEEPVHFTETIDWTYQWNNDFEWTVNLNRSRFMAELGQAYWLTGEERFASAYIRLLKDWISQNPLTIEEIHQSASSHYNVKDTWRKLDSGIRITNWLKGYVCVSQSSLWGEAEERIFSESVHMHGRYLAIAYTPHDKQSNWGFLETNGLFQIALLFPDFEESTDWLQLAAERLEKMCRLQVFSDGMHNEQSPMYHHEVLHCLFEPVLLSKLNNITLPETVIVSLERMLTASLAMVKPNGHQPMLSDSDDTDIRDILTRGAQFFQRGDLKAQGYPVLDFDSLWYFGKEGAEHYSALESKDPLFVSAYLPQAGLSILRSEWSDQGNYLLFDGGHMDIIQAHGHDDFLHVELAAGGKEFLVDTGRYTYKENPFRKYFKESFQHNTTSVDGKSISNYVDSWNWDQTAVPVNQFWNSTAHFDYVQAGHNGYMRLEDPVQVQRQLLFVKPDYWIILDSFRSHKEHLYTQHFHLAEEISLTVDESSGSATMKHSEGQGLSMKWLDPVQITGGECSISRHYNQKTQSKKINAQLKGSGLTQLFTILSPFYEEPDISIKKMEVRDTRGNKVPPNKAAAIEIKTADGSDTVLFSHQGPNSYQFADTHLTGEVLLVKRRNGTEQTWTVKV